MKLQEPHLPERFDDFWEETTFEAKKVPISFERKPQGDVTREGFQVDLISFESVGGRTISGWFAFPQGRIISPGFLWLAPYGRWSMLPNDYGTRAGMCSMSFNFHGESAFHREDYKPERGYFANGIESPETWVFRRMYQDSVVAFSVLQAQEECNAQQIGAMGMSQGGGMAIWLGAYLKGVKAICADMAFGAAREMVFEREILRYPLKEITDFMALAEGNRALAMRTMEYFDTINLASKCKAPTLLTFGTKDPAVREFEVQSIYRALAGEKAIESIDGGHDWHKSMIDRNRDWLLAHF